MFDEATPDLAERIDALVAFLPALERRVAGVWRGGEKREDGVILMPWFEYDDTTLAFRRACASGGWVTPEFDWLAWAPQAKDYIDGRLPIAEADVGTLQRLLTTYIRADRFNEGTFAAMVESGHIAAIVRRLADIRKRCERSRRVDSARPTAPQSPPTGGRACRPSKQSWAQSTPPGSARP